MVIAVWTRCRRPRARVEILEGGQFITVPSIPHVVGAGAVHPLLLEFGAAEVAAADDDGDLDTFVDGEGDLVGDSPHDVGVESDPPNTSPESA